MSSVWAAGVWAVTPVWTNGVWFGMGEGEPEPEPEVTVGGGLHKPNLSKWIRWYKKEKKVTSVPDSVIKEKIKQSGLIREKRASLAGIISEEEEAMILILIAANID